MRTGQTAREPGKPHTNGRVTFIHRTSLYGGVHHVKICQRIGPDKTDITRHGTSSPLEEWTRNACERTRTDRELTARYASVSANSHLKQTD